MENLKYILIPVLLCFLYKIYIIIRATKRIEEWRLRLNPGDNVVVKNDDRWEECVVEDTLKYNNIIQISSSLDSKFVSRKDVYPPKDWLIKNA